MSKFVRFDLSQSKKFSGQNNSLMGNMDRRFSYCSHGCLIMTLMDIRDKIKCWSDCGRDCDTKCHCHGYETNYGPCWGDSGRNRSNCTGEGSNDYRL